MTHHTAVPGGSGPLGATLYMPATHPDLAAVVSGTKLGTVRSVIICLEDAVAASDLPDALCALESALTGIGTASPITFVRPRSLAMLEHILQMPGSDRLAGVALPKASCEDVEASLTLLASHPGLRVMPILETPAVFDDGAMRAMADLLSDATMRPRVLLARIGGNDLLRCLGLRRDTSRTIYESPLGHIIGRLVTTFLPRGIPLSSPVFEGLGNPDVLRQEVMLDRTHGLFTKTAAHPEQILTIESLYRPATRDVEMATALLMPDAPAVFRMHDRMCEVTVHQPWATDVLARAHWFGIDDDSPR